VLILLDCCFAAQAARTNQRRAISSNMELVAACAMGLKTKLPGEHSFTTHIIKHLRLELDANGYAKISDVINGLAHRDSGYRQTPVHFTGLNDGKATIRLEAFNPVPAEASDVIRESAWLTLRISLRDVISEDLVTDLIRWLKAHPKRKVSKLTVEDVVTSTKYLHAFVHEGERGANSGPTICQIPALDQQEVTHAWCVLKVLLAGLAAQVQSATSTNKLSSDTESISGDTIPASELATKSLLALEDGLLSAQAAVQQGVMASPELYSNREALQEALDANLSKELGLTPFLNRRMISHFDPPSLPSLKTYHEPISTSEHSEQFRSLFKENVRGLGDVIVEYKHYDPETVEQRDLERMQGRMETLAKLLQTPTPIDFHSMHCLRWFHESGKARFGLCFEPPKGSTDFISLRELIESSKSAQKPALGQRFSMVKCIGEALLKWHRSANWVHQGIASHNIFFFKYKHRANFDYSNPFLCGFEFARPSSGISQDTYVEDFEMNVYRHPTRQGAPIEYHTKQHDLYSFGVLMWEIGAWALISKCFSAESREELSPFKMQRHIKSNARKHLAQNMGAAYEKAAIRCLDTDFRVEMDDPVGSNLGKAFEMMILKGLEPGIKL